MPVDILYSFVGNHDPLLPPGPHDDPGPVISLLRFRRFDHLVLFVTAPEYSERAVVIQQASTIIAAERGQTPPPKSSFVEIRLASVVDYEEIFARLSETIPEAEENLPYPDDEIRRFVLLDPGTPAMQTVWFLMVRSGQFSATLLQGIPARFAGGTYRARSVDPSPAAFPPPPAADTATSTQSGSGHGPYLSTPPVPRRRAADQDWTVQAPPILGSSPEMSLLKQRIETVARYDETVLIQGETGTGKELVARHIHNLSPRRRNAYIPVNCAALGSGTVDSELFGHEKGAFTGAQTARNGVFRAAHGGTLFLDEIGELPLGTQAKLLRAIEYGELTPVGADRPVQVDARILAASNRDLEQMVRDGDFRADLLQRLRQLDILVPPLRRRTGDLRLLAETFVEQWSTTHGQPRILSDDALSHLQRHDWPGNVRELQNLITRVCTFSESELIDAEVIGTHMGARGRIVAESRGPACGAGTPGNVRADRLPAGTDTTASPAAAPDHQPRNPFADGPVDLPAILHELEQQWYRRALLAAGNKRSEAARLLGLNPPAFRKALRDRFPELEQA